MLEKMGAFFDSRLDGCEEHRLTWIKGAQSFYPSTENCLPWKPHANILDLGCGTGLELDYCFSGTRSTENNCVLIREKEDGRGR